MMNTETTKKQRLIIKFGGESGQGVNSIGEIFAKAIKRAGFKIFGYREYPSLIKGGYASYQIDISDQSINSSSKFCDILVCQSRLSVHKYLSDINPGGVLIHSIPRFDLTPEEQTLLTQKQVSLEFIDSNKIAQEQGGNKLMANMVLAGYITKMMNLNHDVMAGIVKEMFAHKPQLLELDLKCLEAGFRLLDGPRAEFNTATFFNSDPAWADSLVISGNQAFGLGVVSAGVRVTYGYPMTPSSSLLEYLSENYHTTGMVVKQAEDEITAVQMAVGSMFMGTRALVCTSGGGFDLMTETVSLSGMTETPLVCFVGQRPGPATGLPTWTNASDLNLAIYAGHGEFARCVMTVSNAESAYKVIQEAYNIAEMYQLPVIVLSEKQIAEGLYNMADIPPALAIERGLTAELTEDMERYQVTDNGISPRWLPGTLKKTYNANSDEHTPDGTVTEEAVPSEQMYAKRMRKLETLAAGIPEPELHGDLDAQILFVGWGSTLSVMQDVMKSRPPALPSFAYLDYKYLFPLKTDKFMDIKNRFKKIVLIEANYQGQLGNQITQNTGFLFTEKLLKYNGRPFFIEDIITYLQGLNMQEALQPLRPRQPSQIPETKLPTLTHTDTLPELPNIPNNELQ